MLFKRIREILSPRVEDRRAKKREDRPHLAPPRRLHRQPRSGDCPRFISRPSLRRDQQLKSREQRTGTGPEMKQRSTAVVQVMRKPYNAAANNGRENPGNFNNRTSHKLCWFRVLCDKGWYWGPLTFEQSKAKLQGLPDGSFLVRDSSDPRFFFTISFRLDGSTRHIRLGIDFRLPDSICSSVINVVEKRKAVAIGRRAPPENSQIFVPLSFPVSRFTRVRSLQDLSRFVIRQHIRLDHIETLEIPRHLKGYLREYYF